MNVTLTVEASVEPTEDEKKVERALLKLFPSGQAERRMEDSVTTALVIHGRGFEFLSTFRNLIRQQRIRTTARAIFLRNAQEHLLRIYLNKQAAYMGRVSFCAPVGESPHGPISILLESDNVPTVIDYLAVLAPGSYVDTRT
ncbi:MAG TPA: RNA-binding domain-containing protein [Candidatus Acidoferrales bacterium]|nr:RNA-binding domain-containing protein [Candidatus Acidoferrales bacterium]